MSKATRLTQRIRAEYQSVPGLKISRTQAGRLWSACDDDCAAAFDTLVAEGFLWLAPSGRYIALRPADADAPSGPLSVLRCPHCLKRNAFQRDATLHGRDVAPSLRCVACHRVFSFTDVAA